MAGKSERRILRLGLEKSRLVLSDKGKGLAALEKAFEERSTLLTYSKMDPRFDPIRSDVRFTDIQRRMGLAQSFAAA